MNNDLISRSALLEWVLNQKAEATGVYGNVIRASIDAVMHHNVANAIRNAPAVDAEPVRHGRWNSEIIKARDWKGRVHDYYQPHSCSVCHKPDPCQGVSDYCPHCGAKMDGGNEE